MENENSIVSGAASTDVAASYSDEEFRSGLIEAFGLEVPEDETPEVNPEEPKGTKGDKGPEGEPGVPQEVNNEGDPAESGATKAESQSEKITFVEHGRSFEAPREAAEAFAKAVGRTVEDFIDVYQKGCNYDALKAKFDAREKDSSFFEKVAEERGVSAEQIRDEMAASISKVGFERIVAQIKDEIPGIPDAAAEEIAKFRSEQAKPKAEPKPQGTEDSEENAARLRELDIFMANHPEITTMDNKAIENWQKSGISLEEAYSNFRMKEENEQLKEQIAALEKEKQKKEQKAYAVGHSTGSAGSFVGEPVKDPFIEGLFADY